MGLWKKEETLHPRPKRPFFEKSMVGQVYFPEEHKVAVYLPLLGPVGVPLLMSGMKEIVRLVKDLKTRKSVL